MRSIRHRAFCFTTAATLLALACSTGALVVAPEDTWSAISPGTSVLRAIGATVQLMVVDASGAPAPVPGLTWRALEANIVQIDGTGRVTAIAPGTARIVVATPTRADTATVDVRQDVAAVLISPASPSVQVGTPVQFAAALRDPNGHAVTGRPITWASGNTSLATVNASGVVTGVAVGGTTITATSEGTSGVATVTVTAGPPPPPPPPVATVVLAPAAATITVGQTQQLTATLRDAGSNVLTGRSVSWTSANTSIATVNGSGLVTAVAAGGATITATSEGRSGTSGITVTAPTSGNCPQLPSPPPGYCTGQTYVVTPGNATIPALRPGDVVVFEDGTYTDLNGDGTVVTISQGGTASQHVTFVSRNKWGAKIDGQNNTSRYGFNFAAVSYVRIEAFDIFGFGSSYDGTVAAPSASGIMIQAGGAFSQIVRNRIHHISRFCNPSIRAQTGIFVQRSNILIEENVIHDIGRFDPGENGCTYPAGFNKHENSNTGIYIQSPGNSNITIRNNVLYNHENGFGVYLYHGGPQNVKILNNTFAFGNPYWRNVHIFSDADIVDLEIRNNVFYDPDGGHVLAWDLEPLVNFVITNNVASGQLLISGANGAPLSTLPPGMSESNNRFSADLMLLDPAAYDFRLRAGSPAIDWGMSLPDVTHDIERRRRPQGIGYDAGAYERVP